MSVAKRVNLHSVNDLRTALDEHLPVVFSSFGYEQSFSLIDLKLGLGCSTVAIAGFLFWLDKKYSFKDTYWIVVGSIVLYFIISSVMFVLNAAPGFKNNKYIGYNGKDKISVFASTTKFDPIYNVKIIQNDNQNSATEGQIPFNKVFDSFGYFNHAAAVEEFKPLLAKKKQ